MSYGIPYRKADVRLVDATNHEHVATLDDWPIYLSDSNDWFIELPNMSRVWGTRPCRLVTQVDLSDPNDTHQVWVTSEELQNIIQHGKLGHRLKVVGAHRTRTNPPDFRAAARWAACFAAELLSPYSQEELSPQAVNYLQGILSALHIENLSVRDNAVTVADAANGGEQ